MQCTLRRVFEKSDALFLFLSLNRGCDLRNNDLERKRCPTDARTITTMILIIALCLLSFLLMYNRDCHKIDINSASVEALESLPDIGPILANRIVQNRPYLDLWELDKIKGIGPQTIEAIKSKVVVK